MNVRVASLIRKANVLIPNKTVNKALLIWIKQACAKKVPFSDLIIKEIANQLTSEMGIDLEATNGWFYCFKSR